MGHEYPEVIAIENKPIARGDEILFHSRAGWVHHRVVGEVNGKPQTKGDANEKADQYLDQRGYVAGIGFPTEENTAGVVVWSVTVDVLASWVASLVLGVLGVRVLEADVPAAVRDRAFI